MKIILIITFLALFFWLGTPTSPYEEEVVFEQDLSIQKLLEIIEDENTSFENVTAEEPITEVEEGLSNMVSVQEEIPQSLVQPSSGVDNKILFVSQAPHEVWDDFHQETCEEASMIMVVNFFNNKPIDKNIMEQSLIDLVSWQEDKGYTVDIGADEVVEILDQYFGQPASVLTDVSVDHIIAELDKGNLLIAPAAGRNLGNPYFTAPGPIYHTVVIRGYDNATEEFITNDPGTKRGEAFRYSYSQLLQAIADWDNNLAVDGMTQAEMEQGRKVLILVKNPKNAILSLDKEEK